MRIVVTIALLALLSACAGVGVFVPETSYPSVQHFYKGENTNRTKADIAKEWRYEKVEPNISQTASEEIWAYHYSNNWCGALLVVIPLMLPTCTHSDAYHFQGDTLVKHEHKTTKYRGVMCSIFPVCPDGSNCKLCLAE
jgi:hypothetical protein